MSLSPKQGIILMNLGSPDSPDVKDVKKYLKEFLMDERVIDVPLWWRTLLVKGIIVPFRAPKSAHAYASIWTPEGSPLVVLTEQLQQKIQDQFDIPVTMAMRYGNPTPQAAFDALMEKAPFLEEVILLPLYPHYAMSSYETAVEHIKKIYAQKNYPFQLLTIPPYYNNPAYIAALTDSIIPFLNQPFDKILFSYHGIPERHILKSDITHQHCLKVSDCCVIPSEAHPYCYRHQTFITTKMVCQRLDLPSEKVEQSFQSRLGRDKWLTPYTAQRLAELPKEGVKNLLVVCPAFVSDCLETLEEIAVEGKKIFITAGGENFTMIPCLNLHPLWIETITGWIKKLQKIAPTMVSA